jgi:hypothetical protein
MGPFTRRKAGAQNPPGPEPVWLPGNVEVQIVGETFYLAAIKAATRRVPPGSRLPAVLIAEPDNPYDANAVGVYLNGQRVGHLAREIAPAVRAALAKFAGANDGRPPACPAQVIWHDAVPQVILYLDPAPLGLPASLFSGVPDSARVIRRNLSVLDRPAAQLMGLDHAGRAMLAAAEEHRAQADADYGRAGHFSTRHAGPVTLRPPWPEAVPWATIPLRQQLQHRVGAIHDRQADRLHPYRRH